jgi:hypothetical protein
MACPTCSHTMEGIGDVPAVGGNPVFWCPRCGTIETPASGPAAVPKLVHRCQDFQIQMAVGTGLGSQYASKPLSGLWQRLGIAEAICCG